MKKYQQITAARKVLDIPEQATIREIKDRYRHLVRQWHPDSCAKEKELCQEMTTRINVAYETLMAYCEQYKYSFSKEEVHKYLPSDEWWMERFGNDPIWNKE